jgi:hypothetical protein
MSTAITYPSRRIDARRIRRAFVVLVIAAAVIVSAAIWMSRGSSAPVSVRPPATITQVDSGSTFSGPTDSPAGVHGHQIAP